jgi:cytochrome P450
MNSTLGNLIQSTVQSPYAWHWQLLTTTLVSLASVFTITYIYTTLDFAFAVHSGTRPPTVPYAIPFVGHTIQIASDSDAFLRRIRERYGEIPLQLVMLGQGRWTFVPHGQTMQDLFRSSKSAANTAMTIRVNRFLFALPERDLAIIEADKTGNLAQPNPGTEHYPAGLRWQYRIRSMLEGLLQGTALDSFIQKYLDVYRARLEQGVMTPHIGTDEWVEVPDLLSWLRRDMLRAAMEAQCGESPFRLNDDFDRDFWAFDEAMPTLLKETPRWLAPRAWASRDKMVANLRRWLEHADQRFDWTDEDQVEAGWEPLYGSRLVRGRQRLFRDTNGSKEADANQQLGLLWATNSNSIPSTFYALLGVLLSDNLRTRTLAEIDAALDSSTTATATSTDFNLTKLCSGKLLNSLYLETLRYAFGIFLIRVPIVDNFRLGTHVYGKDDKLIYSTWAAHHDATFWNEGHVLADGKPAHPVDSWWGERFLSYPDDPTSGPIKKHDGPGSPPEKAKERTTQDDQGASLVSNGLAGHFYPYGGGLTICPGRHFAKQEILASLALLLRTFEFELVDPLAAARVRPKLGSAFGTMSPDGKVAVRVRRRKV